MPSLFGRLLYYVVAALSYRVRQRSAQAWIQQICDTYEAQNGPETIPISSLTDISTEESHLDNESSGQGWQIFTCVPKVERGNRLQIHYHGGGFILAASVYTIGGIVE